MYMDILFSAHLHCVQRVQDADSAYLPFPPLPSKPDPSSLEYYSVSSSPKSFSWILRLITVICDQLNERDTGRCFLSLKISAL